MTGARCHVCGGSASARGHLRTDRHFDAVRAMGRTRDTGRMARAPGSRDPHGRTRDWDAEAREYVRERHIEEAAERQFLIATTLPDAPIVSTIAGVDYITLRDAAARLGIKPDTLLKAIKRGRMNARKVGRDWLVEESEIEWYRINSLGKVGYPKGRPRKRAA